jgi:serine/threonine protein kinase
MVVKLQKKFFEEKMTTVSWITKTFPRAQLDGGKVVFKPNSVKIDYVVKIGNTEESATSEGAYARVFRADRKEDGKKVVPVALRLPLDAGKPALEEMELQFYFSRILEDQILLPLPSSNPTVPTSSSSSFASSPFFLLLYELWKYKLVEKGVAQIPQILQDVMEYKQDDKEDHYASSLQFADRGELDALIGKSDGINDTSNILHIAFQLAHGLLSMRSIGLVHHDIKSTNVLVRSEEKNPPEIENPKTYEMHDQERRYKFTVDGLQTVILPARKFLVYISDFGFAFQVLVKSGEVTPTFRYRDPQEGRNLGTSPHIAPELLLLGSLGTFGVRELVIKNIQALFAADVFSMGVVFAHLFLNRPPWDNTFVSLDEQPALMQLLQKSKVRKLSQEENQQLQEAQELNRKIRTASDDVLRKWPILLKILNNLAKKMKLLKDPREEVESMIRLVAEQIYLFGPLTEETREMYANYFVVAKKEEASTLSLALKFIMEEATRIATHFGVGIMIKALDDTRKSFYKRTDNIMEPLQKLIVRMLDLNYTTRISTKELYEEMARLIDNAFGQSLQPSFTDPESVSFDLQLQKKNTQSFKLVLQEAYFPSTEAKKVGSDLASTQRSHEYPCTYPSCTSLHALYQCSSYNNRNFCSTSCAEAYWKCYGSNNFSV